MSNAVKEKQKRLAFSYQEVAEMVGRRKSWIYKQVRLGRIKPITGYGAALINVAEIERVFGIKPGDVA